MLPAIWLGLWLAPLGFAQSTTPPVQRAAGEAATTMPVLPSGVHDQTLSRDDGEAIRYAISIPPGYSPAARVPLVLALHFGGNPVGAGRSMLDILIRPGACRPWRHYRGTRFNRRWMERPAERACRAHAARGRTENLQRRAAEGHRHRIQHGRGGHVALGAQVSGAIQRGDSDGRTPHGSGLNVACACVCGAFQG